MLVNMTSALTDDDAMDASLFDEVIRLYQRLQETMLDDVKSWVFDDVKARSRPYRTEKYVCDKPVLSALFNQPAFLCPPWVRPGSPNVVLWKSPILLEQTLQGGCCCKWPTHDVKTLKVVNKANMRHRNGFSLQPKCCHMTYFVLKWTFLWVWFLALWDERYSWGSISLTCTLMA